MESMKSTVLEQGWKVSVIPATRYCQETSGSFSMEHALRVAAYCRVSTGDESQQSSYSKQKIFIPTSFWKIRAGRWLESMQMRRSPAHPVSGALRLIK